MEKNRALLSQFYPIYEVQLDLQSVSFKLNSRNISSIGKLMELIRIHNQSYLEFRQIQKFNKFKPFLPPISQLAVLKSSEKKSVSLEWFRFAVRMAMKSRRSAKSGVDLFKLSKEKQADLLTEFKIIYYKLMSGEALDRYQTRKFDYLISALDLRMMQEEV